MTEENMEYQNHVAHYQKDADFHDYFKNNPIEEHNIKRRYAYFFNRLSLNDRGSILEIGAGGGYAVEQIDKRTNTYIPLDIPLSNLIRIKSKTEKIIYPVSGDTYKLPFKDACIDSIILSEVLEHLYDPTAALKEMSRILLNKGLLIISVPFKEKITYQICVHCNQQTPTHAHFHSFDEKTIKAFLENTDLEIERKMKVSNKLLSRISIMLKLNYLPFPIWKGLDQLLNMFIPKPSHILFQLRKPSALAE